MICLLNKCQKSAASPSEAGKQSDCCLGEDCLLICFMYVVCSAFIPLYSRGTIHINNFLCTSVCWISDIILHSSLQKDSAGVFMLRLLLQAVDPDRLMHLLIRKLFS